MKGDKYGSHRVIHPGGLLPQAAEKIDNNPQIYSNEILIDVIALQPTSTAFGRIRNECGDDIEKIKQEILRIVESRGKFPGSRNKIRRDVDRQGKKNWGRFQKRS